MSVWCQCIEMNNQHHQTQQRQDVCSLFQFVEPVQTLFNCLLLFGSVANTTDSPLERSSGAAVECGWGKRAGGGLFT